jgi:DNA polymerase III sliding clamp (beta) subunit (PCNA family)
MTVEAVETIKRDHVWVTTRHNVDQLRDAIAAVALANDANKYAPPMLRAIQLESEDGHLVLVATDRFRLHVARVEVTGEIEPVLVDGKELAAWAKSAKGAMNVTIKHTGQHVELETDMNLVRLTANKEEYPNWRDLLNKAEENEPKPFGEFAVNGKYAYDMSKAYALATGSKTPHLRLKVSEPTRPMLTHVKGKRFNFTGLLMPIRITD